MNLLFETVIGGIIAGLVSTGLYELVTFCYERWVYLNHPIDHKYKDPGPLNIYNTVKNFSAFFYLRNRTKGYLPILITTTSCDGVSCDPEPIQWIDKHRRYGFQNIVLSPSEWGNFQMEGIISDRSKCKKCKQAKCNITICIEVKIPFDNKSVNVTLGNLELEFK
jgi:hypothetical protein